MRVVKSYTNVWKLNRTFFTIGNVKLPAPVSMNFMIYFIVIVIPIALLGDLLSNIPGIIRYVIIPGGLAWIFDKKMIDGKNPYQFIRSICTHYYIIWVKGYKVNRFKHYKTIYPAIKTIITYRIHKAKP